MIEIIVIKGRKTRMITYTCRYSSGHLICNSSWHNRIIGIKCQSEYELKKQPGSKRRCGSVKNSQCEKSCEIRKWGGQVMAVMVYADGKNLITTVQVNLCCLIFMSLEISTKLTWIVIKFFAINLYLHLAQLAAPFDIITFFHTSYF